MVGRYVNFTQKKEWKGGSGTAKLGGERRLCLESLREGCGKGSQLKDWREISHNNFYLSGRG